MIPDVSEDDFLDSDTIVQETGVKLGNGAYGNVVEVEYKGRKYAAKKYRSGSLTESFSQELEVVSRIRHPNIVPYYGVCRLASDNTTVILMETMVMNLSAYLDDEGNADLSLERKFQILNDIVKGLDHMHSQTPPIVHRDLTATNVLLDSKGTAKICDFGNSRVISFSVALKNLTGAIPGTLNYMPPEAHEGGESDEKLDIFSFGHLSIYVINQRRPHPLLRHNYNVGDQVLARSEVDRREEYLHKVKLKLDNSERQSFFSVLISCLNDDPNERPTCKDILMCS